MTDPILINGLTPLQVAGDDTLTLETRERGLREALEQLPNPARAYRLYAVWCARRALSCAKDPDTRSLTACRVAERFALGRATVLELDAAFTANWTAAWSAAWSASAWSAASRSAAWSAAPNAAQCASEAASWISSRSAAPSARSAADYASEQKRQIQYLLGVLRGRARRPRPPVRTRRIRILI